ncbi:MAG TPA: NUDIX hydrolase [Micromonosporaceae bacterium]|nr:NUDIX hydrolase [Micromonosporaceae bacterium]
MAGSTDGRWTVHSERVVDDTRRTVLSVADIEMPSGIRFEQYVLRVPDAVMVLVLRGDRILMVRRHRFVIDRWVWELPGGYLDPDEDPAVCAAREVEEETGWRPGPLELLVQYQPMVGTIDQLNRVYLAREAQPTGGPPDRDETETVGWVALADARDLMRRGQIVGAGSVAAVLAVLLARAEGRL